MTGKTDKQFLFEVQLNWLSDSRGVLSANDAAGTIDIATPPKFGGKGKPWTPEHLFLSAISSCYMTTYLAFSKKIHLDIYHFECDAIGQIEVMDGIYKFTHVNLYPKVYIVDEILREKAIQVLEKSNKHCLIVNSINVDVIYHSEVLIAPHTKELITQF